MWFLYPKFIGYRFALLKIASILSPEDWEELYFTQQSLLQTRINTCVLGLRADKFSSVSMDAFQSDCVNYPLNDLKIIMSNIPVGLPFVPKLVFIPISLAIAPIFIERILDIHLLHKTTKVLNRERFLECNNSTFLSGGFIKAFKNLYRSWLCLLLLIIHIVCGFTAFIVALIAMAVKKAERRSSSLGKMFLGDGCGAWVALIMADAQQLVFGLLLQFSFYLVFRTVPVPKKSWRAGGNGEYWLFLWCV